MPWARLATLWFLSIALFSSLSILSSQAAGRTALVIGNSDYRYSQPLANPVNDASDVADMLEGLGFNVIRLFNGDFGRIREAIRTFNAAVSDSEIGIVYYAGHGMELGGENWLIPIDAELKTDRDLPHETVNLKTMLESVSRASQLGLIILDSCRDNPFVAKMARTTMTRSVERGLARVEPTKNVLVAYAAKDGTIAADGSGRNSPYTSALLKYMPTSGLEVSFIFRKVRDDVLTATERRQQPFVYGSLSRKAIYLRGVDSRPPSSPSGSTDTSTQPTARKADTDVWATISRSTDESLLDNFIRQFPESSHLHEAKERLAGLQAASECDRVARGKAGPDRERKVDFVPIDASEQAGRALRACELAMAARPELTRYIVQGAYAAESGKDYGKALELYEKASERGSTVAMVRLGALFESGMAGAPSYSKARSLYQKAVTLGASEAATRLGRLYEMGLGNERSYAQAVRWYRKAAERGDREAMSRLATFYDRGLGVRKDRAQARMWRQKSSAAKATPSGPAASPRR
jgi:uncharacterized caspase-like protein